MEISSPRPSVFQCLGQRQLSVLNHVRTAKGATPRNACRAMHQHSVCPVFVQRVLYEFVAPIEVLQDLLRAVVANVFKDEILHSFVFEKRVCVWRDC